MKQSRGCDTRSRGTQIDGIVTNLPQLRAIIGADAFRTGDTHTGFLTEHWHPGMREELPPELLLAIAGYDATQHTLSHPTATNSWQSVGPLRFGSAQTHGVYESVDTRYTLHADHDAGNDTWLVAANTISPLHRDGEGAGGEARFTRLSRTRLLVHQGAATLPFTLSEESDDRDTFTITWRERDISDSPRRIADPGTDRGGDDGGNRRV